MKIHLPSFKEGVPTKVCQEYDPKQLDLEFVDLKYLSPLVLDGIVEKGHDALTFRGRLTSEVDRVCGRCLTATKDRLDQAFELFYEIKGLEDLETLDDLRECLILEHPISYVCKEGCLGLCLFCGINLNNTRCECKSKTESGTKPFSVLRKIQKEK